MKLFGADGKELMNISAIDRQGSDLVVKGKIFGTMPLTAKLKPSEARKALPLMSWRTRFFLLTFLFRRG